MEEDLIDAPIRFAWYNRKRNDRFFIYGNIIESHFGEGVDIYTLSKKFHVPVIEVSFALGLYKKSTDFDLTIPSKV